MGPSFNGKYLNQCFNSYTKVSMGKVQSHPRNNTDCTVFLENVTIFSDGEAKKIILIDAYESNPLIWYLSLSRFLNKELISQLVDLWYVRMVGNKMVQLYETYESIPPESKQTTCATSTRGPYCFKSSPLMTSLLGPLHIIKRIWIPDVLGERIMKSQHKPQLCSIWKCQLFYKVPLQMNSN